MPTVKRWRWIGCLLMLLPGCGDPPTQPVQGVPPEPTRIALADSTPEESFAAVVKAAERCDLEAFRPLVSKATVDYVQKRDPISWNSDLIQMKDDIEANLPLRVVSRREDGETVFLAVKGPKLEAEWKFVREDGSWKLDWVAQWQVIDAVMEEVFKDWMEAEQAKGPHPTDEVMVRNFLDHEKDFDRLAAMAKQDAKMERIAADFTRPESEPSFTKERWDEYRLLFKKLGLDAGIEREGELPGALICIASTRGLSITGSGKGYACLPQEPTPLVDSLDHVTIEIKENELVCKKIKGNWYLWLQVTY